MQPTYFDIEMLAARIEQQSAPTEPMPMLGLLTGMVAALAMWSGIAVVLWALLG